MRSADNRVLPVARTAAALLLAAALGAQAAEDALTPEEAARRDAFFKANPGLKEQFRGLEEQANKARMQGHGGEPAPAGSTAGTDRSAAEAAYRRGDYRAALQHYEALAAQGDAEASIILGTMYEEGRGVPRDEAAAYAWYGRAAAQGNPTAREIVRGMNDRDDLSPGEYRKAQEKFEEISRKYDEDFDADRARRKFQDVTKESNVNTRVYER